jgi:short-subunit dehydrogenase
MAERGDRLVILGRDREQLERSAKDLEVRSKVPSDVVAIECDLADPSGFEPALAQAEETLGRIDAVVVSAGLFAPQERLETDAEFLAQMLAVNFTNTVLFCEVSRKRLLAKGGGTLCVFSSVAGDRGRKPVILYGAAKAGLSRYLEGLDHRYREAGLRTVCVKPGFVKTSMTEGLEPPPFAGEPHEVARRVLKAIEKGWPVVYAPAIWQLVMLVIRSLPRFVMRRVGF